jgi:hypothetical protein
MPPVRLPGVFFHLALSSLFTLLIPVISYPHDGKLDEYGCHYDQGPKRYHCHEGIYKLGSFRSKTQMIQLLRLQYLNLGRPWPYSEIGEEDITSIHTQAPEPPRAEPKENVETPRKVTNVKKQPVPVPDLKKAALQLPKSGESAEKRQTASRPAKEAKQQIKAATSKAPEPVIANKNREIRPIQEWAVKITSDGNVIYENSRHERYYVDKSGKRVDVRNGQ